MVGKDKSFTITGSAVGGYTFVNDLDERER